MPGRVLLYIHDLRMAPSGLQTVASQCIAVRVRLLNRVVTRIYDEALRPLGLKVSQMNVLVAAGMLGVARPGDVCERLCLEASTLSRNLERLRAQGWIESLPGADAREQPFRLTQSGKRLLERARPKWDAAQARVERLLGRAALERIGEAAQLAARGRLPD